MANLETLELTINGSAEKAGQGISDLISRLSNLSDAITKPYSDLRDFNSALKETAKLAKSVNFKNAGKGIGAAVAKGVGTTPTKKNLFPTAEQIKASYAKQEQLNKANALPPEAFRAQQEVSKRIIQERMAATIAKRQAFEMKQQAKAQAQIAEEVKNTTSAQEENTSALGKIKSGFKNVTSGASTFFGKVKRIATTMLIRSAIRGLIRDMKEGVSNLYEWSKLNNGEFAKSFDTIKAKGEQMKNSVGAAIAPAIQAAIPIINALANAAITAFNWVNQLISLLTGKGYWTRASANVDGYTDSVNKAGGAAQEWLATFDELNVMTSGGGGGGGGGGADYSDMFENVYQFDSKLKEITDFLKDNFESIKAMAIATGVAILGWKLSTGFAEVLPTLSKIAGLIGVGAVIGITLQADWLLTNKYLQTGEEGWLIASALTTAVGSVAAAAMAKQIFNGKAGYYAAGITLALSAITDIVANVKNTNVDAFSKESLLTSISAALKGGAAAGILLYAGGMTGLPLLAAAGGAAALTFLVSIGLKLLTQKDDMKWGDISLTQDQIQAFVTQRMFESPVDVLINQYKVTMDNRDELISEIRIKASEIETELNVLKLGVDEKETLNKISTLIPGLTGDIERLCDVEISTLKLTFGNITAYDGNGSAMDSATLLSGIAGWRNIKEQMEADGKELSEMLIAGAKGELEDGWEEYAQKLLEKVQSTADRITKANEFGEASATFSKAFIDAISMDELTEESFKGVVNAFKTYSSEYESTIRDVLHKNIASWYALADLTDDPELAAQYRKIADDLTAGFEKTVSEELNKQTASGKQMILDWILGRNEAGSVDGNLTQTIAERFRGAGMTAEKFTSAFREFIHQELGTTKAEFDAWDLVEFSGWDLLSNNLKKQFLKYVVITPNTIKELQKAGVSADELVEFVNWNKVTNIAQNDFVKAVTSAYGSSGIALIKHKFPDIKATDVIKFSAWDEFSNVEKLNFLDAIEKAFGANEAKNAAKSAGKDIETAIREGMASNNEDIRKQAEKWANLIGIEIKKGDYTVNPTMPKTGEHSPEGIANGIKTVIANTKAVVDKITAKFMPGYPDNLKGDVENVHPIMKPIAEITEGAKNTLINVIQAIKPTITANVKATGVSELSTSLKKALSSTLKLSYNGGTLGSITLQAKAGGGLVTSGDMFIANENGVPEMIGRFGNQTGVANTGQIVAGISKGVSDANAEQNALLREQNALLRAIYEKEGSNGFPGASSALGRVVRQSLNMYDGMVGG